MAAISSAVTPFEQSADVLTPSPQTTVRTRQLLRGSITLKEAEGNHNNVALELSWPQKRDDFFSHLERQRSRLSRVAAHHLGLSVTDIKVCPRRFDLWRHGSFNVVVWINKRGTIRPDLPSTFLLRFPLPYRVGESTHPGNASEKLYCEAATYAWIAEHCPDVPIPRLYGFGTADGPAFTHLDLLPRWTRWYQQLRRFCLRTLGLECPSMYVRDPGIDLSGLGTSYLLLENVSKDGRMLSSTFIDRRTDEREVNLYRGLARIMLSLARIPQPRIGSLRLDSGGYFRLDNRPLNMMFVVQENEAIPSGIPRSTTFADTSDYVAAHLTAFDHRFLHQPNTIATAREGHQLMAHLAAARLAFPKVFRADLRRGPFYLTLDDIHQSNILVDEDWNVTRIFDLEFAVCGPAEFLQPPSWLDGRKSDEIDREIYGEKHAKFVSCVEMEEQAQSWKGARISGMMRLAWQSGAFWAALSLQDFRAFQSIFNKGFLACYTGLSEKEIVPSDESLKYAASFWAPEYCKVIEKKLADYELYTQRLRCTFEDPQ